MSNLPLFFSDFFNKENNSVRCELCPNFCNIPSGKFGACGVRGNKNNRGIIPFYGYITALAVDPIEKKPLYHFKSGSKILSLGFAGCNFRCPFCQNWHISQSTDVPGRQMKCGEIISAALQHNTPSIAYTYSEPLIHIEYLLDCMTLARSHNIANVLVTNGCINAKPAAEILKLTDAVNVDLKCFNEETYKKTLAGSCAASAGSCAASAGSCAVSKGNIFHTVLDFIKLAYEMKVHLEITTLVVPELNNTTEELLNSADFIASIDKSIPWHLSAYHPDYRWNAPPTDPQFIYKIVDEAKKKLDFVYAGNIR